MAKQLKSGSQLIRSLQLVAILVSCIGIVLCVLVLSSPSPELVKRYVPLALVAFLINALTLIVVVVTMAARGLVRRIGVLGGAFTRGAQGDLTVRVDMGKDDELGQLGQNFNHMLEKLSGMVLGINAAITELQAIAARNDEASRQVIEAAGVQAEGVAETATVIEAINLSAEEVSQAVAQLARSSEENIVSIREMANSIHDVRTSVEAQAGAIQDVSSSILQTAAVVEETDRNVLELKHAASATSVSLAEMDSSIRQVESSVHETASVAQSVLEEARRGKEAVEATIAGIDDIRASSGNTYGAIDRLSERVAAIDKILAVIQELTEQTNLLALNSAILAAQAGEHGKGFAIVSGEIKGLADRTRSSTREIAELIDGIREETGAAVTAIRITEERVADGEKLSLRSGNALNRIVASVQVVTDQVNEIARAAEEQSRGSMEIQNTMQSVANAVTRIATSSKEQTATSRAIMKAVELMRDLTDRVLVSTTRQEHAGRGLAESTEQMTGVVEVIRAASVAQADSCIRITASASRVQGSTDETLAAARTMGEAVESLADQIQVLRAEIAKLQVT